MDFCFLFRNYPEIEYFVCDDNEWHVITYVVNYIS
jgi:hypothetical protein